MLGIHDGHNASACLLRNGEIIAAISEERLSRVKNDAGYPRRAVDSVLEMSNCAPDDIDVVALSTRFMHPREFYFRWDWYRIGYGKQLLDSFLRGFRGRRLKKRLRERKIEITQHLKIPADKIVVIEHHLAHAATAYYGCPWSNSEKVLVLTLDGSGDGICSTVSIGESGRLNRIAETKNNASIGKVYSRITYLLGMKPWEHEYKLTGLAPYADEKGVTKSYQVLSSLVNIGEGELTFRNPHHLSANYCYEFLKSNLENHRFDWIAGAAQKLTEDLVTTWVRNAVKHTGIRKVACAGGVFMNVKVNLHILELEEVEDLFVFPSCGDESTSIGAAYVVYTEYLSQNDDEPRIEPLGALYLGPAFSEDEIKKAIHSAGLEEKYSVQLREDINELIPELLASGKIVARFDGRTEWGARALGNRSILADPRNSQIVRELNAVIKQRDFWMPFAPTILYENQSKYSVNPKMVKAPYMVLAFQTTEQGRTELVSAMHPYDFTIRPQVLEEKVNPDYYRIIKRFEELTGVSGVLNTSFNLHGEPIVYTPSDAIRTFENSGLNYLALGRFLITK